MRTPSAVRWGVAGEIVVARVLTIPAAALVAAVSYVVLGPILGWAQGRSMTAPYARDHTAARERALVQPAVPAGRRNT